MAGLLLVLSACTQPTASPLQDLAQAKAVVHTQSQQVLAEAAFAGVFSQGVAALDAAVRPFALARDREENIYLVGARPVLDPASPPPFVVIRCPSKRPCYASREPGCE
ncbi:hypothetical protein [Meiothermus luteus]|uniref:hypothetical protein n=1 Tax=Meiothermus luteus TaxID=2026184 RepID=UPI000E6468B7|nr:hypothetical protein [Meiothermus luteus]